MLLGERCRMQEERLLVKDTIEKEMRVVVDEHRLYGYDSFAKVLEKEAVVKMEQLSHSGRV